MNSNTRKPAQDQERETNGHFSLMDTFILVDTPRDARALRKHFGIKAIVFLRYWEEVETCEVRLVVVSARGAYRLAESVIERYGPWIDIRFVHLEETLENMARQRSSRFRLYRLIRNPWHMTETSGSC